MITLRCTTIPGLEDLARDEVHGRLVSAGVTPSRTELKPFGLEGQVLVEVHSDKDTVVSALHALRTVERVVVHYLDYRDTDPLPLAHIQRALWSVDLPELYDAESFRVTSVRAGEHDYSKMDVQRVAGTVLQSRYGTDVDLEGYQVNVHVDVFGGQCVLGVELIGEEEQPELPPYRVRASLRPAIASGMVTLARLPEGAGTVADPFCGSGTILLEAARRLPAYTIVGSDTDPDAVSGTQMNAAAFGVADRVRLFEADARRLDDYLDRESLDGIITNPPYGLRLSRHQDLYELYTGFLRAAHGVLKPGGRLVLLAVKRRQLNRAVEHTGGYSIEHVRILDIDTAHPGLFVLSRR
jgi:23S rRNA G2445 N2-methylase RlmL